MLPLLPSTPAGRRGAERRGPLKILLISNHRRFKIHFRAFPWAQALAARGHAVDVFCHADTERWRTKYEERPGFRIVHNPDLLVGALRQGWDPVCAFRRGVLLFGERRAYDIIHCLDTRPAVILPGLAYARAMGIPIVSDWIDWWGRGGLIRERRPWWYQIAFGGFETFFEEHFRNKLDGLTTISSALLERGVALGVPRHRCLRIPGGADLTTFSDVPARDEARRALGIPLRAPVVCFSGLDGLFDLPLAVGAFERILNARPDAYFLFVGPTRALVSTLVSEPRVLDRMVCTGPVPHGDLPKRLAAADVFLMPYADKICNVGRWPNKIGDFMCVGRPTVSNPVGEVTRLFEQFDIGVLAPPTPQSMADATVELLGDPVRAEEIGRRARAVAVDVFAWERLIENLERWYYDVLAMGTAQPVSSLNRATAQSTRLQ